MLYVALIIAVVGALCIIVDMRNTFALKKQLRQQIAAYEREILLIDSEIRGINCAAELISPITHSNEIDRRYKEMIRLCQRQREEIEKAIKQLQADLEKAGNEA